MPRNTILRDGVEVPVYTVVHLTDRSHDGVPAILGRQYYDTREAAEKVAHRASTLVPAPQRFTVYCPDLLYVSSWQAGKRLAAFTIDDGA